MKYLIVCLFFSVVANASVPDSDLGKFEFSYTYKGVPFTTKVSAMNYEGALARGADRCMDFYLDQNPNWTKKQYVLILDECANPNSRHEGWDD